MLLNLIRNKKVLFFGGKGGVGKTTVSSAAGLIGAGEGRRVLLVSTDPAHNLGHLFERRIGPTPVHIAPGLSAMELDPAQTVKTHLDQVGSELRRLMPEHLRSEVDKHLATSRHAPGMEEAAMLERIADVTETAADQYDLVIFDTAPSGHTARLMALPEMISAWTEGLIKRRNRAVRFRDAWRRLGTDQSVKKKLFGPRGEAPGSSQDREERIRHVLERRRQRLVTLRRTLTDERQTAFVIVLAAERLPVLETIELHEQLARASVDVAGLVVNKRVPENAGRFLSERRDQEKIHLKTLYEALPNLPRQDLELIAHDVVGLKPLQHFANQIKLRSS